MKCKQGAAQLIDEIINTLTIIPEESYSSSLEVFDGGTLGKHFRHIHDFFSCLITQCEHNHVDYAKRKRDVTIENQKDSAIKHFDLLKSELSELDESKVLKVYADFMLQDGSRPEVQTTIGRELMYAYDHAVHHLAIVKIGLQSIDPSLPIKKDLGVAASTTSHQYASVNGD